MTAKRPAAWNCVCPSWSDPVELVGDGLFPARATIIYVDSSNPLEIVLTVEVRDGAPVFRQVGIAERPGADLTPAALRKLDWPLIFERVRFWATSAAAMGIRPDLGEGIVSGLSDLTADEARSIERVAEGDVRRRRVNDALLRDVAAIVRANPAEPTKAVAAQRFTSHRNATRWIATARERGFLVDGFSREESGA
ncbi:MAG TPA: hypothetical protein VMU75_08650 [Acidimicrobiales bacterium]|nr:hypothetical protein [Acidimicrobiales bacterium]